MRKGTSKIFPAKSDNDLFRCRRVWAELSERRLFKEKEDAFQREIDSILARQVVTNHRAVTEYMSIWGTRDWLAEKPPQDWFFNGRATQQLTKDQEEALEKNGVFYLRDNVTPARFVASLAAIKRHVVYIEWTPNQALGTLAGA